MNANETLPRVALEAVPSPRRPDDLTSLTEIFGRFLRLYLAEGDASPATIRTYHAQAAQYVAWWQQQGVSPSTAAENDIIAYRKYLVETGYKPTTIALKLAVLRRLYEAIQWRGLRDDDPAAGVKSPRDRTARDERVKYLPLDGLKQLLAAPQGDGPLPRRNRAILALMGVHGLRVSEVAGLKLDSLDLNEGVATVLGKGRKVRTVYLTDQTTQVLAAWLEVRESVALDEVHALFVVVGPNGPGTAIGAHGIRYLVDKHLKELGLKAEGISCHALRHSAATWSRAGGARLDAIAGMLGHTSVTTTGVYAKIVDKIAENPARYLEELMGFS